VSLIDWSDPEEMVGLLVEYVADEAAASYRDSDRAHFLNDLRRAIGAIAAQDFESVHRIERALREIHGSQPTEFASDPVMAHLQACIEEMQRIGTLDHR
jgi:hypothetical protein